jgi:parvulin-like peptidyl-prolyl isomerase
VIIAAVVFLAGIVSWVGYEFYEDYKSDPMREVVIEVNGVPFTMEYFVKLLDAYTTGMNYTMLLQYGDYFANQTADEIIGAELLRQGAKNLGIEVTTEEIEAKLKEYNLPNDRVYQDMIRVSLLQEKVGEYFGSQLPDTIEQAHVQVMLVESEEVADEVITKVEAGGNFTALAEEFSCNSTVEGDLGWLPEELMPNTLIADAAFNLTLGETRSIYEETATKNIGYWLIEVTDEEDDNIKARAMLLGSEAEAEQVKAELDSANFSSLAEQYSQHESKDEGGELGWLKPGDMGSEAFDQVAFNITANEVSEPVKDESVPTTGGYWLVKVVDRGNHELEDEVREQLIGKHFNDWLEEWSEESTIETYLEADKLSWAVNKVLEGR